jgi:hypothetical protein
VAALADFGDRQWLQALAAVLVGLVLAGGAAYRAGPLEVPAPWQPARTAIGAAGCALLGHLPPGAAAIMPRPYGHRR